jgi:hypothetical protein
MYTQTCTNCYTRDTSVRDRIDPYQEQLNGITAYTVTWCDKCYANALSDIKERSKNHTCDDCGCDDGNLCFIPDLYDSDQIGVLCEGCHYDRTMEI